MYFTGVLSASLLNSMAPSIYNLSLANLQDFFSVICANNICEWFNQTFFVGWVQKGFY